MDVADELGIGLTRLIVRSLIYYPGTIGTVEVPVSLVPPDLWRDVRRALEPAPPVTWLDI